VKSVFVFFVLKTKKKKETAKFSLSFTVVIIGGLLGSSKSLDELPLTPLKFTMDGNRWPEGGSWVEKRFFIFHDYLLGVKSPRIN
jgi:hypothetical protein